MQAVEPMTSASVLLVIVAAIIGLMIQGAFLVVVLRLGTEPIRDELRRLGDEVELLRDIALTAPDQETSLAPQRAP